MFRDSQISIVWEFASVICFSLLSMCPSFQHFDFNLDPNILMSACQLPVHNPPEWKPLPVQFPANIVLRPISIYVFYQYPIGILGVQNHLWIWIWCLASTEGMLVFVYHPDLLQFSPPSLPATIFLFHKPWNMAQSSIRSHCLSNTVIVPALFLNSQ